MEWGPGLRDAFRPNPQEPRGRRGGKAAMKLDLSSLRDAVGQLEKSLRYLHSRQAAEDPGLREQFRAATIQAFEYVYDLSARMVRRQLEQQALNPAEVRKLEFMALMRQAADAGLVSDPAAWHTFRELRNRTSHTYDADEAETVVASADAFLAEAKRVLSGLERKNA
jgi:nucleotidyltransferase substrate binding protein (TIGR01987 family)